MENHSIRKPLKGKTKPRTKIKPAAQKTKITKFFQIIPTENSGLKTGACVKQNSLLSSQYGGGGSSSVVGEGRGAVKRLGLVTDTTNNKYELCPSGGPTKLDVENQYFAVWSSLYTDEELKSNKA